MLSSSCRWPRFSMLMLAGCSVLPFASANEYDHALCLDSCRHEHIDCVRNDGKRHHKSYDECLRAWTDCNHSCVR